MTDFEFEFQSDADHVPEDAVDNIEQQLRNLADGHDDVVGASIALSEIAANNAPDETGARVYRARTVIYMKPKNRVAAKDEEDPELALRESVDAAVRQVREHWAKLRSMQRQGRS